ncbi:MAG: hypothetical protein HRT67_04935 [Flavobacteriaceae bacterium]|nr:hypothetical protein [Flavobacteriaceae bacterium]
MHISLNAQQEIKFTKKTNFYIKGNALVIGNNSISKLHKKSYNDFSKINDLIEMRYIDVDRKPSTFSSSAATLEIEHPDFRIKKAVLYWSGVYPYSKGVRKIEDGTRYYYHNIQDRKGDFTQVKLNTPNTDEYIDIQGHVIFDGFEKKNYKACAPYVCSADVTDLLTNSNNANGEYTVANVRATEGFVSGGSMAGWCLFVVYESEYENSKYITSYDGFATLSKNVVDIQFEDFVTKANGQVNANIMLSAMEGDSKLSKDQCFILNKSTQKFHPLRNKVRSAKNFFNGKITNGNTYMNHRKPNGANALGFDLLTIPIPKEIIANNQKDLTLRLSSMADRFYFYFTAFKTEIKETYHYEKIEKNLLSQGSRSINELKEEQVVEILGNRELTIPNAKAGYYIITNVFSEKENAINWIAFMQDKGHEDPYMFRNPENNWYYVSVYQSEDVYQVYKNHQNLEKLDYFEEIWVFKINLN